MPKEKNERENFNFFLSRGEKNFEKNDEAKRGWKEMSSILLTNKETL
jgi:hypothetical protein